MTNIKNTFKRYLKSFNAVFWIVYYKSVRKNKYKELFKKEFKNVHVVCPGPSVQDFFTSEHGAGKEDVIILVNHALNLYPDLKKFTDNIFYFSSDGTRVKESIKLKSELLEKVFSVVSSVHLFHLDKTIIRAINVATLPRLTFTKKFGFTGVNNGPNNFGALKKRPIASGFGSLVYSLQLAVKFNPEIIRLWGCDFGDNKGKRYFTEDVPARKIEAFEKTKKHFEIVEKIIKRNGINIIR
jgi:hypothetical protein